MTTIHKNLTGADLHEPKGADTALSGQVYVADGIGSGAWVSASSIVTNQAFSTGDLKPTHKSIADTTWIMWSDGTIGDSSSGATIRANADTVALFTLYYGYSNTLCPVSGGRGASAAADYAAHKTIAIPKAAGRAFGLAGAGSGLTTRAVGDIVGGETGIITQGNLPSVNFIVASGQSVSGSVSITSRSAGSPGGGSTGLGINASALEIISGTFSGTVTSTGTAASGGSGTPFSVMQPTSWVNVMIKL